MILPIANDAHRLCAYLSRDGDHMTSLFNPGAPKKATNLSVNSDLLEKARKLNINLSATLEKALDAEVRKQLRDSWLEDNAEALDAMNTFTDEHGLFSDAHRKL